MQSGSFGLASLLQANNNNVAQVLELWEHLLNGFPQARMDEECLRTTIVKQVNIVGGVHHCIQWNRNRADLDRTKKVSSELWRVEQNQGHTLLHLNTKVEYPVANAVGYFSNLRVDILFPFIIDGGPERPLWY